MNYLRFYSGLAKTILTLSVSVILFLIMPRSPAQESFEGPKHTTARQGAASLPSEAGQIYVDYDLTPYTSQYPNLQHPEQTILSWIMADTGESFWFGEPFGFLSADSSHLRVYHTVKVQQYISNVLDRFMDPEKKKQQFTVKIVSVDSPDWRTKGADWIRPYPAKAEGVSCWTLDNTGYTSLMQFLSRRSDFEELNQARNIVPNAETFGWVFPAPKREYSRDIQVAASNPNGFVTDKTSIDEGYRIEVTPLLSTNGDLIEFMISCNSTVVEKMHSFALRIPTSQSPRQQLNGETPQIATREVEEKISFPRDRILLIDLGLVPIPEKTNGQEPGLGDSLSKIMGGKSLWRDLLVFVAISAPMI